MTDASQLIAAGRPISPSLLHPTSPTASSTTGSISSSVSTPSGGRAAAGEEKAPRQSVAPQMRVVRFRKISFAILFWWSRGLETVEGDMRSILLGVLVLAFGSGLVGDAAAQSSRSTFEHGVDRPGGDFSNIRSDGQNQCSTDCEEDAECRAWTYVRPGVQGPTARCYLKRTVPDKKTNGCCISGVMRR